MRSKSLLRGAALALALVAVHATAAEVEVLRGAASYDLLKSMVAAKGVSWKDVAAGDENHPCPCSPRA